jgi:hypothetical protein
LEHVAVTQREGFGCAKSLATARERPRRAQRFPEGFQSSGGIVSLDPALEERDIHEIDEALAKALSGDPHPEWAVAREATVGSRIIGDGRVLKTIKGMGTVYDWRQSPWTPANGGRIHPVVGVQHIPVVPNVVGVGDFVTLRNVLVAQGLMVQSSTDREGNVGLVTPFDILCYQARGANQISWGSENMHLSISEPWSKKQLRAVAWVVQLAEAKHGIPVSKGQLGAGSPIVKVLRRGAVTHEDESNKAGFHDRTDPGAGLWGQWDYVEHCVRFFREHGHMSGA